MPPMPLMETSCGKPSASWLTIRKAIGRTA
jgi:hypothetical protein